MARPLQSFQHVLLYVSGHQGACLSQGHSVLFVQLLFLLFFSHELNAKPFCLSKVGLSPKSVKLIQGLPVNPGTILLLFRPRAVEV